MRLVLNGSAVDLGEGASLADAVVAAGADLEQRGIAVALEGEVVPRGRWRETRVVEGQRVEVLEARQGG